MSGVNKMHHANAATSAGVDAHTSQAQQTRGRAAAGLPRPRSSTKRNQKEKKLQQESHAPLSASGSLIEQRLHAASRTKRLDLSKPKVPSEPPSRSSFQVLQMFPSIVIEHEHHHHLTELWLTNHHIGILPAEIAAFTRLRILGLAGNVLTTLPVELYQLRALERLYLEKNRLQVVPGKVAFPPQLRELRLDNNQLSVFPMQLTKLRLLNRLGLSRNHLKALPEQIHRLHNLVELDLDYNILDAGLPDGFASLQRLERLGLEGNLLEVRPSILDRLPVLSYVRLSGNRGMHFLDDTSGSAHMSTRQPQAVPKRHDGYFRCVERGVVEGSNEDKTSGNEPNEKPKHRMLEGLVPCQDQNLLNTISYDNQVTACAVYSQRR